MPRLSHLLIFVMFCLTVLLFVSVVTLCLFNNDIIMFFILLQSSLSSILYFIIVTDFY